jgi:tight adherence protein B
MKVRAKIKSLTAEGRMSAIVLSLVPVILFALLNLIAPGYYSYVYGHPATMTTLFIGL